MTLTGASLRYPVVLCHRGLAVLGSINSFPSCAPTVHRFSGNWRGSAHSPGSGLEW